jgi:hypothetical protein
VRSKINFRGTAKARSSATSVRFSVNSLISGGFFWDRSVTSLPEFSHSDVLRNNQDGT